MWQNCKEGENELTGCEQYTVIVIVSIIVERFV